MKNKKFIITVLIFIVMISMIGKAYAASFSARLVTETARVAKGAEIKVTFQVSSINVEGGINSITAALEYDEDVLSLSKDKVKDLNDWVVNFNEDRGTISCEKQDPIEDEEEIATFTFKVAENTQVTSSTIKLKNIEGNRDDLDSPVTISPISATITISSGGSSITSSPSTTTTTSPSISTTPSTTSSPSITSEPTTTSTPTSTTTNGTMPDTGASQSYVLPLVAAIAVLGIVAFLNYRKLDDNK